jgi:hypothetical protein
VSKRSKELIGDYEVGYARPPIKTRWTKGQSGNPEGSSKSRTKVKARLGRSVLDIILAEGNRRLKVREGDREIELTTFQATLRSLQIKALKGDKHAAKMFIDLYQNAHREDDEQKLLLYLTVVEYIDRVRPEFERCAKLGLPPPDFAPHPDDIKIDHRTGKVYFLGPMTRDERDAIQKLTQLQATICEDLTCWREESELEPFDSASTHRIERFLKLSSEINSVLPPRLRRQSDA